MISEQELDELREQMIAAQIRQSMARMACGSDDTVVWSYHRQGAWR